MKMKMFYLSLFLIPALFLAACSGASLAVTAPDLPAQLVNAVQAPAQADGASTVTLADLQSTFEDIYAEVNPSVVNIQVGEGDISGLGIQSGLGSGFVWDKEGYVVTNNHVGASADQISVTFSDGRIVDAELVGTDPYSDLAVIKVDEPAEGLQPVEMADSTQVKVGQIAIAIGNPFGLQGTMTQGIISGLSRSLPVDLNNALSQQGARYSIPDIIQTDASINPGNSGGVLVDDQGKVIGVTSAIATTSMSNSGVGFVIPSGIVKKVVPALIEDGSIQHAYMGITGTTLTPDLVSASDLPEGQQGALVIDVAQNGPADEAGIRGGSQDVSADGGQVATGGDVITALNGQPVTRFEDMVSYLYNNTEVGQTITLTVLRDGQEQEIQLTLGALPDPS
jgi:2-alkenal reductase